MKVIYLVILVVLAAGEKTRVREKLREKNRVKNKEGKLFNAITNEQQARIKFRLEKEDKEKEDKEKEEKESDLVRMKKQGSLEVDTANK